MIYSTVQVLTWRLDVDRQADSEVWTPSLEILNFCVCALSQKGGTPCSKLVMHENKDVYVVMLSLFSLAQFDPCPRTRMDSGTDSMD
jgi:hypothetical protein